MSERDERTRPAPASRTSWPSSRPRSPTSWTRSGRRRAGRRTRSSARSSPSPSASAARSSPTATGSGRCGGPGPGLWPFVVSRSLIVVLSVVAAGRRPAPRRQRDVHPRRACCVLVGAASPSSASAALHAGHRLRDPGAAAVRRLAAVPRRRDLAQHGRGLGRAPSPRSTCCSSRAAASRCPTCSRRRHHGRQRVPRRLRRRHRAAEPALLPDRRGHRHADRRAARPRPGGHDRDPAADRPTASTRSRRSSCWPASTTAPSTAAPSPRCCCGCPARRPRWSPSSTASRWPSRAGPAPRSASPRSARSSAPPSRSSG